MNSQSAIFWYMVLMTMMPPVGFTNEAPWSTSEFSPVMEEPLPAPRLMPTYFWDQRFDHGYYFYQKVISPADGARCAMYPTCADYAYQALQKHGLILGTWMATDRLMRDHGHGDAHYTPIFKFGRQRLYDPVFENDFWFKSF